MLILKALIQYHEATDDKRVPVAVEKALHSMDDHIRRITLFNWGQARWFETLIPIYWLHEKNHDAHLLDLAVKLQAQGCDWTGFFENWPLTEPTPKTTWNFLGHVVNNAMAIKAPGLWWRLSGSERDRRMGRRMIELLDRYHGMVTGVFSGDECLAGRSPSQGVELCAVVEYMYTLETLLAIHGDAFYGDRLEKIAFNALPATFSPDMWAHQYDQQPNQARCAITPDHLYTTNGPESNLYGLEPNFGCCTANLSQGWPKFAAHLWMKTQDGGLVAAVYAPGTVKTRLGNAEVVARMDTQYPFRNEIRITITTDRPARFPLLVRIPSWTERPSIDGEPSDIRPGAFHRIEREWKGAQEIRMVFPMPVKGARRFNNAMTIERGPLVYALNPEEEWKPVNTDKPHREPPHGDWEVHPLTPWNYALDVDEDTLSDEVTFTEHAVGSLPFSPEGAPVSASARGRRLPEWTLLHGAAGPPPQSPVRSSEPEETLRLIPYGCTNLRITEFPVLERKGNNP
jgi:hypothetical protein